MVLCFEFLRGLKGDVTWGILLLDWGYRGFFELDGVFNRPAAFIIFTV